MPDAALTNRNTDLSGLFPPFRERLVRGLALATDEGLPVHLFEGGRSGERQDFLYSHGRGLPGKIVTNVRAGASWHQYWTAADLAFDSNPSTLKVEWTWDGNWKRLGEIMMGQGLEWYGAPGAPFPEAPHFQLTGGLPLNEARRLLAHEGLPAVWAAIKKIIGE